LWTAFVWPDLVVRADVATIAGQYIYPFPTSPVGMTYDMVRETWTAQSSSDSWSLVSYGIDEDFIKPGSGENTVRGDSISAWDVSGPDSFRVFPTPDTSSGWVRFKGQQQLAAFAADSDRSTLDATAIVMMAAAELLARAKAEDAANKMQKAQRHLTKLLGNKISAKNKITTLGAGAPARHLRDPLAYGT
jgi:hypothetical protein